MENQFDVGSFFIYLVIFTSSLVFVKCAEIYLYKSDGTLYKKRRRSIGIILLAIAIFIPCIFAAYRGLNVGTDISTYIIRNFEYGCNSYVGFGEFREHCLLQIPEILFSFLMFVCCKIGSLHLLFFLIEALVMIPLAFVLVKTRGKESLVLEFSLFYLLFYNFSLSGMRQSIAMRFFVVAIYYAIEKNKIRSVVFVLIAQLFHSSLLIVVALLLVCYFINKSRYKKIWWPLFIVIMLFAFFCYSIYSNSLVGIVSRLNPRYGYFIQRYFHSGINISEIPTTDIIIKSFLVFLPMWIIHKRNKITELDNLMLICVLLGRYFVLFNGVFYESMRIAYYFDLFIVLYVPRSLSFIHNRKNVPFYKAAVVSMAFLYWVYFIMYIGGYGTNLVAFNV